MDIARVETFDRFGPLFRFRDEVGTVDMADDDEFGRSYHFKTRDRGWTLRVAEVLEYGMVVID